MGGAAVSRTENVVRRAHAPVIGALLAALLSACSVIPARTGDRAAGSSSPSPSGSAAGSATQDPSAAGASLAPSAEELRRVDELVSTAFSYDYRTLAADRRAAEATASGEFAQELRPTLRRLASAVPRERAKVSADVVGVAALTPPGPQRRYLVMVDETITNRQQQKPQVSKTALEVTAVDPGTPSSTLSRVRLLRADSGPLDAAPSVAAAVRPAPRLARALLTVDHRMIQEHTAAVKSLASGEFRDDFAAREPQLVELLRNQAVRSRATVLAAGLEHSSGSERTVLVSLATRTQNRSSPKPRSSLERLRIIVTDVDGRPTVSSVQPL